MFCVVEIVFLAMTVGVWSVASRASIAAVAVMCNCIDPDCECTLVCVTL